jgi:hypothetical protein
MLWEDTYVVAVGQFIRVASERNGSDEQVG